MRKYIVIPFLVFIFFSCISHKQLLFLKGTAGEKKIKQDSITAYQVQSGDLLDISVNTPVPGQTEIFSKEYNQSVSGQANPATLFLRGYVVDDSGSIQLPLIGLVKVAGYNTLQISDTIKARLSDYLEYVSVTTKIISFRVTLLGEVKSPGTQFIYAKDLNIFQAIGFAGDFTDLANRKHVKLVRKINEKETKVIKLDLGDSDLISSEYYYLHPNDVIYVEPLKAKVLKVNSTSIQVTLSLVTLMFIVINFLKK